MGSWASSLSGGDGCWPGWGLSHADPGGETDGLQPEGNFQGVALPQLPRPLHTGPAGLSFLFKARATGLGKGMGRGRWRLGQVVCVLGPEKLWGPAWSLPEPPPLLASPALRSTPPLCPALTQPCHFRPELNWGLTWPSSKAASRVSFLSYRADHITPDSGIEFRFRIKEELFSPKFDALHNSSLLMLLPRTTLPTRPGKTLAVPLKSYVLSLTPLHLCLSWAST